MIIIDRHSTEAVYCGFQLLHQGLALSWLPHIMLGILLDTLVKIQTELDSLRSNFL